MSASSAVALPPQPSNSKGWAEVSHDLQNVGSVKSEQENAKDKQSFEAIVKRIANLRDPQDELKLTPLRAHYLKKALVKLQTQHEVELLSQRGECAQSKDESAIV